MKTYKIEVSKKAQKFINDRNFKERKKIYSEIYKLPNGRNVLKMSGFENRYRLRVGDFRIIYDKFDDKVVILVLDVGNRGDIYKR